MPRDYIYDQGFSEKQGRPAGRGATVTAIDIDIRFLEQLAGDTVEVRRVDIRIGEVPRIAIPATA
jgi:hypothetical protein